MANHRAAALLTIASLLVAVALADARLTVHLDALGRGRGIHGGSTRMRLSVPGLF
jgi:hypothetical protein